MGERLRRSGRRDTPFPERGVHPDENVQSHTHPPYKTSRDVSFSVEAEASPRVVVTNHSSTTPAGETVRGRGGVRTVGHERGQCKKVKFRRSRRVTTILSLTYEWYRGRARGRRGWGVGVSVCRGLG